MTDKRSSRSQQISIYIKRCFRVFQNTKGWKIFISVVLISLMVSLVTGSGMFSEQQATKSGAFAWVCACFWIGIFNSIRTICGEREIVKREHRTGLHISSYMLAHWFYEAVICLIETIIIYLFIVGKNYSRITDYMAAKELIFLFLTIFLITFASDTMGLMISSIVPDETTAMTVMPFALILQLIMSGMIFELEGITKAISTLTISRWGLDLVLMLSDYNNMGFFGYSDEYTYSTEHLLLYWGLLAFFTVLYLIIGTLFMEMIDKSER